MKKKILIVDDDDSIRWIVERKVTKSNYKAVACGSYEEALRVTRKRSPDLIISDYDLSHDSDGIELATQILNRTKRDIPVIIMSGYRECHDKVLAKNFEYLAKPFDLTALMALIKKSLEKTSVHQAEGRKSSFPRFPTFAWRIFHP